MSFRFRLILLLASVTLGVGAGVYIAQRFGDDGAAPAPEGVQPLAEVPEVSLPSAEAPLADAPPLPDGVTPIKDRATIDFSSGTPVYRDDEDEQAIIDAALAEMNEAVKGVTFGPTTEEPASP